MSAEIDRFIPAPDVRERHVVTVRAPAGLVYQTAREFDMQSIPIVRAIFWLRATAMGARRDRADAAGLGTEALLRMGWGTLVEEPGRLLIAGARCQPWLANVVFTPIAPDEFAAYAEPDQVKIAWTLEAQPLETALTRFATETRAVVTDDGARAKFRRYWRTARFGIVAIRLLLLPAVRLEAEKRWRATGGAPA